MINLAPQQEQAVKQMAAWYKNPEGRPFVLNGYAGTGKTTLARQLPELVVEAGPDSVAYCAYTGKAALQLKKKGCEGASTLHRLLYKPLEKDRTELQELLRVYNALLVEDPRCELVDTRKAKAQLHEERQRIKSPSWRLEINWNRLDGVKLIVVDESSMVDERIYKDLLEVNIPVVFCGDPFQLPPVRGQSPVSLLPADITLTDVHRQALESPVLRAATDIREGKRLESAVAKQCSEMFRIMDLKKANYETYAGVDQVLCGRNATRAQLNGKMRQRVLPGAAEPLVAGDRVVFLKNDHREGIYNGTVDVIKTAMDADEGYWELELEENRLDEPYEVWGGVLLGQDATEKPDAATQLVDRAYALTVHKAQGSEWDSVLVHDDWGGNDHDRWLYTAVTRARNRCVLVQR